MCGLDSWSSSSFPSGIHWFLSPTLGKHLTQGQAVGSLVDDDIFLLGNRLVICGVESPLKSTGLDLLLVKYEGCNMIALQVSVDMFLDQAIIVFRGEA